MQAEFWEEELKYVPQSESTWEGWEHRPKGDLGSHLCPTPNEPHSFY